MGRDAAGHRTAIVEGAEPAQGERRLLGAAPTTTSLPSFHLDIGPGTARAVLLVARGEVHPMAGIRKRLHEWVLAVRAMPRRAARRVNQSQSLTVSVLPIHDRS